MVRELAEGRAPWALPWPLCLTHGVQALWTADRDFTRFPRLRTVNPLI
jgi:predicted nucleic acid-binding protein